MEVNYEVLEDDYGVFGMEYGALEVDYGLLGIGDEGFVKRSYTDWTDAAGAALI